MDIRTSCWRNLTYRDTLVEFRACVRNLKLEFHGWQAHTWLTSTKKFTNLNLDVIVIHRGFHISYDIEYYSQCIDYNFLVSERLQGTHMNALMGSIDKIDPTQRFVNLFSNFSSLWDTPGTLANTSPEATPWVTFSFLFLKESKIKPRTCNLGICIFSYGSAMEILTLFNRLGSPFETLELFYDWLKKLQNVKIPVALAFRQTIVRKWACSKVKGSWRINLKFTLFWILLI